MRVVPWNSFQEFLFSFQDCGNSFQEKSLENRNTEIKKAPFFLKYACSWPSIRGWSGERRSPKSSTSFQIFPYHALLYKVPGHSPPSLAPHARRAQKRSCLYRFLGRPMDQHSCSTKLARSQERNKLILFRQFVLCYSKTQTGSLFKTSKLQPLLLSAPGCLPVAHQRRFP